MQGNSDNPPYRVEISRFWQEILLKKTVLRESFSPLAIAIGVVMTTYMPVAAQESDGLGNETPLLSAPSAPGRAEPLAQPGVSPSPPAGNDSSMAIDTTTPELSTNIPESLPVVVELFTSQGCSSCPPADEMMAVLAEMPNVIPLSIHVDYWDYLGWADSFAKPEFTKRQENYARAAGEHSLYTPQMIFDGQETAVAPGPAQLMGLLDARRAAPALVHASIERSPHGDEITVMPLTDLSTSIDVLLIRYAPERTVKIRAGENRGHDITYVNVVLSIDKLTDWDGKAPLKLTVLSDEVLDNNAPLDAKNILFVQEDLHGEGLPGLILAAVKLD